MHRIEKIIEDAAITLERYGRERDEARRLARTEAETMIREMVQSGISEKAAVNAAAKVLAKRIMEKAKIKTAGQNWPRYLTVAALLSFMALDLAFLGQGSSLVSFTIMCALAFGFIFNLAESLGARIRSITCLAETVHGPRWSFHYNDLKKLDYSILSGAKIILADNQTIRPGRINAGSRTFFRYLKNRAPQETEATAKFLNKLGGEKDFNKTRKASIIIAIFLSAFFLTLAIICLAFGLFNPFLPTFTFLVVLIILFALFLNDSQKSRSAKAFQYFCMFSSTSPLLGFFPDGSDFVTIAMIHCFFAFAIAALVWLPPILTRRHLLAGMVSIPAMLGILAGLEFASERNEETIGVIPDNILVNSLINTGGNYLVVSASVPFRPMTAPSQFQLTYSRVDKRNGSVAAWPRKYWGTITSDDALSHSGKMILTAITYTPDSPEVYKAFKSKDVELMVKSVLESSSLMSLFIIDVDSFTPTFLISRPDLIIGQFGSFDPWSLRGTKVAFMEPLFFSKTAPGQEDLFVASFWSQKTFDVVARGNKKVFKMFDVNDQPVLFQRPNPEEGIDTYAFLFRKKPDADETYPLELGGEEVQSIRFDPQSRLALVNRGEKGFLVADPDDFKKYPMTRTITELGGVWLAPSIQARGSSYIWAAIEDQNDRITSLIRLDYKSDAAKAYPLPEPISAGDWKASPDGKKVAFMQPPPNGMMIKGIIAGDLYVLDAESGVVERAAIMNWYHKFDWSNDSSRVYFTNQSFPSFSHPTVNIKVKSVRVP